MAEMGGVEIVFNHMGHERFLFKRAFIPRRGLEKEENLF